VFGPWVWGSPTVGGSGLVAGSVIGSRIGRERRRWGRGGGIGVLITRWAAFRGGVEFLGGGGGLG
jgi:hypothetical protein